MPDLSTSNIVDYNVYSINIPITIRVAWECPRCNRINAPHIDYCSCEPIKVQVDFIETKFWINS